MSLQIIFEFISIYYSTQTLIVLIFSHHDRFIEAINETSTPPAIGGDVDGIQALGAFFNAFASLAKDLNEGLQESQASQGNREPAQLKDSTNATGASQELNSTDYDVTVEAAVELTLELTNEGQEEGTQGPQEGNAEGTQDLGEALDVFSSLVAALGEIQPETSVVSVGDDPSEV